MLHQYITASYNLSLLLSDKIFCRDFEIRKFILGSLSSLGRLNFNNYQKDKLFGQLIEVAPFGIDQREPKHNKNVYRGVIKNVNKTDFLLIWNGGIWNWNDGETLIQAMNLLKNKNIKLIFQGFRHPNQYQKLSTEAKKTYGLAKNLQLVDKNVFFINQWLPYSQRGNFLTESNAGIVTAPNIPEANFFLKTRIYDYIWAGLPTIINDSEAFSSIFKQRNLGLIARTNDPKDLAKKILQLEDEKPLYRQIKANIKKYKKEISWTKTLSPVNRYLKGPIRLMDKYNQENKLLQNNIQGNIRLVSKIKI